MKMIILILILGLLLAACSPISEQIGDLPESTHQVLTHPTQTVTSVTENHPTETPQLKFCPYNPPKPASTENNISKQTTTELTYQEIEDYFVNYSEQQWRSFVNEITGLRVHWTAVVMDINEHETVTLDMGQMDDSYIILEGLTKDVLLNLEVFTNIVIDAKIENIATNTGLAIWLIEPIISILD